MTTKLVSVAPRSRRLNSSIFPRLRSHPIHTASPAIPLALTVEEEEAVAAAVGMLRIQGLDAGACRGQNVGVTRERFRRRVAKIGQQREVDVRIDVAKRLDLEMRDQLARLRGAVEDRGDDDHRAAIGGHAVEFEARQPPRRDQPTDDVLDDLNHQLAGRDHHQQRDRDQRRASPAMRVRIADGGGDEQGRPERQSCPR